MIIARDSLALYAYVCQQFADDRNELEIVVDRRQGARGQSSKQGAERPSERRVHMIDDRLRALGWALVRRSAVLAEPEA